MCGCLSTAVAPCRQWQRPVWRSFRSRASNYERLRLDYGVLSRSGPASHSGPARRLPPAAWPMKVTLVRSGVTLWHFHATPLGADAGVPDATRRQRLRATLRSRDATRDAEFGAADGPDARDLRSNCAITPKEYLIQGVGSTPALPADRTLLSVWYGPRPVMRRFRRRGRPPFCPWLPA